MSEIVWTGVGVGIVCLALVAGCSHRPDRGGQVRTPLPPPFLTGPIGALLTNTAGFTARLTMETKGGPGGPGSGKPLTGELMGRGSHLLFVPDPREGGKKRMRPGFSFIWDVAAARGYVLSEALQAYAPVTVAPMADSFEIRPKAGASQQFDGHPCEPTELAIEMTDGPSVTWQALLATDLSKFPLQVRANGKERAFTLTFSKVRLEPHAIELFEPPKSFNKYATPEALVDELAMRQSSLKPKKGDRPAGPNGPRDE